MSLKYSLIILIYFLAHDYEEPSELPDSILPFSQIGPPRNVSVNLKPDGFFVSWDAPEYGQDQLGLYVIRWYLEPEHKLHGSVETRNNFYIGERIKI